MLRLKVLFFCVCVFLPSLLTPTTGGQYVAVQPWSDPALQRDESPNSTADLPGPRPSDGTRLSRVQQHQPEPIPSQRNYGAPEAHAQLWLLHFQINWAEQQWRTSTLAQRWNVWRPRMNPHTHSGTAGVFGNPERRHCGVSGALWGSRPSLGGERNNLCLNRSGSWWI